MDFIKSSLLAALVLVPFSSFAEDDGGTKLVLEAGIHAGGDRLITATFTDGSTEEINAGDGISLAVGAKFALSESLDMVATYGMKWSEITASNGSIDWTRYPLNAIILYKQDLFRFGGGLTYHMSPTLEGTGIPTYKFDNALGILVEAQVYPREKFYFGARLTFIDYQLQGSSETVNGNSVGLTIGVSL